MQLLIDPITFLHIILRNEYTVRKNMKKEKIYTRINRWEDNCWTKPNFGIEAND